MGSAWPKKTCNRCGCTIYMAPTRYGDWKPYDPHPFGPHRCGDAADYAVARFIPRNNRFDNPRLVRAELIGDPDKVILPEVVPNGPGGNTPKPCPKSSTIKSHRRTKHQRKQVAVKQGPKPVSCPVCGVRIPKSQLRSHALSEHRSELSRGAIQRLLRQ